MHLHRHSVSPQPTPQAKRSDPWQFDIWLGRTMKDALSRAQPPPDILDRIRQELLAGLPLETLMPQVR